MERTEYLIQYEESFRGRSIYLIRGNYDTIIFLKNELKRKLKLKFPLYFSLKEMKQYSLSVKIIPHDAIASVLDENFNLSAS